MTDPTRHRQLEELDTVNLCTRILYQARSELYVNMRFLDVSLSSLGFEADWGRNGLAVDGAVIHYGPEHLMGLYRQGRARVNRAYLHMLFHCLFCHMYTRRGRDRACWDLSCDIAMESVLDGLYQNCIHVPPTPLRREAYLWLAKALEQETASVHQADSRPAALTADRIYHILTGMKLPGRKLAMLQAEFFVDSHDLWESEEDSRTAQVRQNQWNDDREKVQSEMEAAGKDESEDEQSLLEQLQVENRERYDYSQFLRKFAVLREEVQVDADSFDYAFYTYGLSLYGNMPLIEPLETREVYKVEEFAVVVDTSMSCSGELVKRFLEETYDVLSEAGSYFNKVHIHIIQCDDAVRSDVVIEGPEDLRAYMDSFQIIGGGGTDFRPAFLYVNGLRARREVKNLKGLIYFTDGKGIYPVQAPPYDTAFVFMENLFSDESVPPWAMKVVLEEEQIMEYRGKDGAQPQGEGKADGDRTAGKA